MNPLQVPDNGQHHDSSFATTSGQWTEKWEGHMSDGVGATSGVTPLAFLAANDRELLLSGNRGTFRIPQLSVKRISRGRFYPWLFRSVQIHHDLPSLPRELQFKPMQSNAPAVLARLKQLGYPVA